MLDLDKGRKDADYEGGRDEHYQHPDVELVAGPVVLVDVGHAALVDEGARGCRVGGHGRGLSNPR